MADSPFASYQFLKSIFTINTIFGLMTSSVAKTHVTTSKKKVIYNLILLFVQIALVTYCSFIIVSDMKSTIISKATNFILPVLSTLYVGTVWILSIFYQKRHINFISKLVEYDTRFKTTYGNMVDYEKTKTFIKHRLIYYSLVLTVFFTVLGQHLIKSLSLKVMLQSSCYILPVTLTIGLSLQFTTYVEMIRSRLQFLNKDTINMNSLALASRLYFSVRPKRHDKGWSKNIITVLRQMTTLHHKLCGQIVYVMRIYGVMLLGMIAISFTSIVIGAYYSLNRYRGYKGEMHITQVLAIFFATEIIFICHVCENTVEEVNKTGTLVHKIDADEPEFRDEIELFSLQIANEKAVFDVAGFFPINHTLLFSIIGGATTYVIILVQLSHN